MKALNIVLLIALTAATAANFAVRSDASKTNAGFLPDMVHSVAYDSFAPNPNFPDGKTLQPPVPGTIPRGYHRVHYQPLTAGQAAAQAPENREQERPRAGAHAVPGASTPEDAARAGEELHNPRTSGADLQRGSFVFQTFCVPCHGAQAKGDGPVALRGYPAPPSLLADKTVNLKDGQMFHILTFGQKNMPSYASQLPEDDRWRAITYVRSLQRSARP